MRVITTDISRIRGMSVQNVMVREVITVNAKDKVKSAWIKLMEKGISGAPVIDDEESLVGIVSTKDIYLSVLDRFRRAKTLRESRMEDASDEEKDKEETRELTIALRAVAESTVSSLLPMNQQVQHLGPLDSLERAIKLMAEKGYNRLPVLKDGKVAGIITRQDVIMVLSGRTRR